MRILLTALLLASATVAYADSTPDVSKMKSDDCARARAMKKTCVLSIDPEAVDGKTPTITETTITIPQTGKSGSLIRIRRDFIVEILKTAEDL